MLLSRSKATAVARLGAGVRRGLNTDALTQLQLDIAAAQVSSPDDFGEPAAPVEKSPAALRGESLRGDVRLPVELQQAVNDAITGEWQL